METAPALLLLSGLPLERRPSFFRQLRTLAALWNERGKRVVLGGPCANARIGETAEEEGWCLEDYPGDPIGFGELVKQAAAGAVIALGYPDQFPFLGSVEIPCFLWSQFSRPPRRPPPKAAICVPLTEKTAAHLRAAGCSRVGPVIPHGVDSRVFAPFTGRRGSEKTFLIGTVANNSRRKRLDLIIRSFALFSREDARGRLLIKTDRPVSLDGVDLPALIARENLGDRVRVIAQELEDAQMAELYNRMDLYVNLSEWEGFCIPVIEAMACGVPVVCPPAQGPGELLPYRETLVRDGSFWEEEGTALYRADPPAVSRIFGKLAGDRRLRQRLSREGREAVLTRYGGGRIVELWEDVLQRM